MENYREYCNRLLGLPKNKKSILSEMRHTSLDSPILSPTAIPTPIIGGAVRGSVTGGLPSGADQFGDISPSRLGGYEKVDVNTVNSKLVDNTPKNPEIASPNPENQCERGILVSQTDSNSRGFCTGQVCALTRFQLSHQF